MPIEDGIVGRQIKFLWGGNSPGDEIKGVRQKAITLAGTPVNVTSDDDDGVRQLLNISAEDQVGMTISGVTKDTRFKSDWFNHNRRQPVSLEYPDGSSITGQFYLENYADTGPYNDAATFTASLVSTGPVTYTPAP